MSDTLEIFGQEYTNVAGFRATDDNDQVKTYIRPQGNKSITANGTDIDVAAYATASVAVPQPSGTITISQAGNTDVTNYATANVPAGTAGTPTATKGTVSNHSVTVTPSVTNSTGWITGSTKTGTGVTVSASELVSGNLPITQNGNNIDVTNYSTVSVNVSGGSTKNIQVNSGSASVRTNGYTSTGISLTVAKTGTYKVTWTAWRSSSQGVMGTNLYRNDTAGTAQQTWTNTYGQHITLTNQSYSSGDVLTLYATAGSTSRYCWVAGLTIEEQ